MPKLVSQMECFLNQFGFVSCNTMSKISELESDLSSCCAILIDVNDYKRKSWGGKCKTTWSTSRGQAFHLLSSSSIIRLNPNENWFVTQPFVLAEFWTRVKLMLKPSPDFVHYILTHFRWFWNLINNSFLREKMMALVLSGRQAFSFFTF